MNKRQKLYIGSNLKMYKAVSETISYLNELAELTSDIARDELCLFIIPSFTALYEASQRVDRHLIKLGAQNMFWEDKGPWTGEISPIMLREMEIDIVEIGHSERRQWFGETDFTVNKKVLAGLRHNLITLICIGETMQDKTLGINVERLRQQVKIALHGVSEDRLHNVWIAYEPVWAIGESGTPATPEYASSMHGVLRQVLMELYPKQAASIPLLYGGSVNPSNAKALIVQPEIDGLFIGRAAWDAASFNSLIRSIQEA